jgi:hypothetical protein
LLQKNIPTKRVRQPFPQAGGAGTTTDLGLQKIINNNIRNILINNSRLPGNNQDSFVQIKSQQATPMLNYYDSNGFYQQQNMSMNMLYTPQLKSKKTKKNKKDPFMILKNASAVKDSLDDEANRINLESVRRLFLIPRYYEGRTNEPPL